MILLRLLKLKYVLMRLSAFNFKTIILGAFAWMVLVPISNGADLAKGKTTFVTYCASCHNKNMKDNLTGPALGGTVARWASFPKEDLYAWVRNSQALISKGHPRATELWNQFKPTVMTAFPNLTNAEIDDVLAFIEDQYKNGNKPAATAAAAGAGPAVEESKPNWLMYVVGLSLLLLAVLLSKVVSNLNYLSDKQDGVAAPKEPKSIVEILTSKSIIGFLLFVLIVVGGYTTVNNAIALGRQQNYQPTQPIKFSHATHAGIHKIDCQYCHDGARRSKQSVIPAANTCMNCHKAIKTGSKHGTEEITKIYASIGFDPSTDKYIENYDKLSQDQVSGIYKKWIAKNMSADGQKADQGLVDHQWQAIKTSLTSEVKPKIQGPIQWVRIHNLPDHAYFNHSQHVTAGKVACQQCHGKVENMEVVKQYAPLSMGWCINCHRQTEVKFKDNPFYNDYKKYHEEIKSGKRSKVTVEEIGGLECQKCHY